MHAFSCGGHHAPDVTVAGASGDVGVASHVEHVASHDPPNVIVPALQSMNHNLVTSGLVTHSLVELSTLTSVLVVAPLPEDVPPAQLSQLEAPLAENLPSSQLAPSL